MRGHVAGDTLSLYLSRLEQPQTSTPLAGRAWITVPHRLPRRQETRKFKLPPAAAATLSALRRVRRLRPPGHHASGWNAARLGAQGMPAIWLRNRPDATR
jgi:hypothetical protein